MAKQSVAELTDFIRTRMRMSHIYQPVVIRSLLDSGNVATVRQLALDLLSSDEAQIRYYEDRIKKMPLPVLRRSGVISTDRDGVVRLKVDRMTFEERAELRAACDQAIGDFLSRRGLATWDNRLLELEPVPESVRYEVLKRDGRCLLCGATPQEERLEVDHIKPRSKGGGNGADNLQTLCGRCNRGKSNRDDSDFRQHT